MDQMQSIQMILLVIGHVVSSARGVDINDCSFYTLIQPARGILPRPSFRLLNFDPLYDSPHQVTKWTIEESGMIKAYHGWSEEDFESAGGYDLYCSEQASDESTSSRKAVVTIGKPDQDNRVRVLCVEFHPRGETAFQIRNSEVKNIPLDDALVENICEDVNLIHDYGLIFVYFPEDYNEWVRAKQTMPYMSCSLDGGFAIKNWVKHSPQGTSSCRSPQKANLRVEDECEKGGGMLFTSSKVKDCKSPLYGKIYKGDALDCFTSWFEGGHEYVIAYDENPNVAMCIRMPRKGEREQDFQIQIFFDGICRENASSKYADARSYLKVNLYSQNISGVCQDISPWCSQLKLDTEKQRNICPGSSHLCDRLPFWEQLTTPDHLRGNWFRETEYLGEGHVKITDKILDFQHLGRWRFAGENKCLTDDSETTAITEYLLVSLPGNGCRPRAALLRITIFSHSVMGFQLSHGSVIEPALDRATGIWHLTPESLCEYEGLYFGEIKENLRDRFHIGEYSWYNLIRQNNDFAECDISRLKKFTLHLGKDKSCQIKTKQSDKTSFDLVTDSCTDPIKNLNTGQVIHHKCLAYFEGKYKWKTYIITKSLDQNPFEREYICWLLSNEEPAGLITRVSDCHDETMVDIDSGHKTPLATISFVTATSAKGLATTTISQQWTFNFFCQIWCLSVNLMIISIF